jgi:hypothetical protein
MTDTAQGRPYADWAKYKAEWWTKHFSGELAYFWPPQLDRLNLDADGDREISRDDVFAIAATESEHSELHTAVAAYVWGVGSRSRGRIDSVFAPAFTDNADTVEDNLRLAADILKKDGAVAAYESMLTGSPAKTNGMGPAYFTKFLFFMGYRDTTAELRPLILDSRAAKALSDLGELDAKEVDSEWSGDLYRRYLIYCQRENPADPEAVEKALFNAGGSGG